MTPTKLFWMNLLKKWMMSRCVIESTFSTSGPL
jgi:hypothetical protein